MWRSLFYQCRQSLFNHWCHVVKAYVTKSSANRPNSQAPHHTETFGTSIVRHCRIASKISCQVSVRMCARARSIQGRTIVSAETPIDGRIADHLGSSLANQSTTPGHGHCSTGASTVTVNRPSASTSGSSEPKSTSSAPITRPHAGALQYSPHRR